MKLNFRQIDQNDIDLLFRWINDPVVRSQSYNTDLISYQEHVSWFEKKILSHKSTMFIFCVDKEPMGLVRFDKLQSETVIGILIDANFRGLGLAARMLIISIEKYVQKQKASIFAYIKIENKASEKAFIKAGFDFSEKIIFKGQPSMKYVFHPSPDNIVI